MPAGMTREVLDLKYEGAPPISIIAPKFKEKPKLPFKPRPWEESSFGNSARKDGLVLRHWRRKGDISSAPALPVTPADSNMASEMEQDEKAVTTLPDSHWAKFNVKVDKPHYTDEQYETHLKSDDWSKDETDYLVELATDFDLRWIVIADRYEYIPKQLPKENEDAMDITPQAKLRTQEDMKARYYDVAAKAMVLHNPLSSMSSSEFDAHEKMTKYDPNQEKRRKMFAEQLMSRTDEEKFEEEMLLKELSRIVLNQEKLFNERKALYDRLGAPPGPPQTHSTAMYQSSQGLTQLMQSLLAQNKSKELEKKEKRRSAMGAEGDFLGGMSGMDRSQRHSIGGPDKRYSFGQGGPRPLSAREEQKYGVSHPNERLTGGVQFRHERITKAGQAKSGVQTSRISAALTELKIPPRLTMPTAKVVTEYEKLIESIKTLLEVRKMSEKLDGEIKVWRAQKEQQEAKDRGEEVKEEEPSQAVGSVDDEDEDEDTKEDDEQAQRRRKAEAEEEEEDDDDDDDDDRNQNRDEDVENHDLEEQEEEEDRKEDSDEEETSVKESSNKDEEEEEEEEEEGEGEAELDESFAADQDDEEEEEGEEEDEEMPGDAEAEGEAEMNGENRENDDNDDVDANGENEDDGASSPVSAVLTARSEGLRKRSASVISHVSNKSSKRQKR